MDGHEKVVTPEGWVDCSCGWQSNHPRLKTEAEAAQLADPAQPDPADHTGDPDPARLNDDEWQTHVIAVERDAAIARHLVGGGTLMDVPAEIATMGLSKTED